MAVDVLSHPAELRAQRVIGARDRRRAVLLTTGPALRVVAFGLVVAGACGVLYGWAQGIDPLVLFASAVALAGIAHVARRAAPPALGADARAQATVREVWRVLRADADEPRPYARHAVWACEAGDGTVALWRLTRPAGERDARDGGYVVETSLIATLHTLDTVAAAKALAEADAAARRDEEAALEARGLARALQP